MSSGLAWVVVPASALSALMVARMLRFRGPRETAIFLGLGLPFFWLRELFAAGDALYAFPGEAIRIGPLAVMPIVGWFFTALTSLCLAEDLLDRWTRDGRGRVFPTLAVAAFVTLGIGDVMETTGQAVGWWTITPAGQQAFQRVVHGAHWLSYCWSITTLWFLLPYLLCAHLFRERVGRRVAANAAMLFFGIGALWGLAPWSLLVLGLGVLIGAVVPATARLRYMDATAASSTASG